MPHHPEERDLSYEEGILKPHHRGLHSSTDRMPAIAGYVGYGNDGDVIGNGEIRDSMAGAFEQGRLGDRRILSSTRGWDGNNRNQP